MAQKLEAIRGGGGSIRVGATGTVGSLMARELNNIKSAPQTPTAGREKPQRDANAVVSGSETPRRRKQRKSLDRATSSSSSSSSSSSNSKMSHRSPQNVQKTKIYAKNTHRVPMLGSDNIALERTPSREKTDKKLPSIVEVVDIKCGNPDKAWASPITSRLRKLGFSKLSESTLL